MVIFSNTIYIVIQRHPSAEIRECFLALLRMTARTLINVIFLWLFVYGFTEATQNDSLPVLTIEDGLVRGTRNQTVGQGMEYFAFRGIPFAKPPIGNLRFKDPIRNDKWNGTLNATSDKSQCVQGSNPPVGSEDCLYINVYTPTLTRKGLAVMVWIYGGAFTNGNSSYASFAPDYLLERDIVFVSLNYRLGVFGFLSTEDLACPGNGGLKDQTLALEWVQRNIGYFGGNSSRVTIFGQSAGAASVSYLTQSNLTKGLFSATILESGDSLCLWALNRRARRTAFEIGSNLEINTTNSLVLVQELRKQDAITLQVAAVQASAQLTLENPLAGIMFSPVMEPDHKGAFFSKYSDQLLRRGGFARVPLLMGMTSNEASAAGEIPDIIKPYFLQYQMNPDRLTPADLTNNSLERSLAGNEIRYRYFKTSSLASQPDAVIQFISDDQFNRPIRRTVLDTMNYTKVFFYEFSYQGVLGGVANRTYSGVGHGEELGYIFRGFSNYQASPEDSLIRNRMVSLWTNFAKYHDPTPCEDPILQNIKWPLANSSVGNLLYLNIDKNLTIQQNPFKTAMTFWDNIYKIFGDPPYNTF